MRSTHENHRDAALYWAAVSLIVCEGLPIRDAAERLGVEDERLRDVLRRRHSIGPFAATDTMPITRPLRY
jgi:hypothetical protein